MSLAKEFANARLHDVSPDGTKLCLEDWKVSGYPLRIVEIPSWKTVYTGNFQQRPLVASFFADGQALFLDFAGGKGGVVHRQTVVDVRTGESTDQVRAYDPFRFFEQMSPIADRVLLVAHYGLRQRRGLEWLSSVEFTGYRELTRVKLSPEQRDPTPLMGVALSAERNVVAYFFDGSLICRRTGNLEVLWERSIETGLRPFPLALSARGKHVAACISRGTRDGQFMRYTPLYVSVHEGAAGDEVARLPADRAERIALSPDGKLLAIAVRAQGEKREELPTVQVYDVPSGVKVATVVHDRIPPGRRQFLQAGCDAAFTSDGKYLVTSGMVTKVWRLGE